MDYRSLVNKLEAIEAGTYISEATAPTQFKPTHFHKGNLGNENPVMQTPDGAWWHETSQGGEQGGGYAIVPWQGNTKNRSKWNPASIDGIYINGKPVEFPEGVTWDTYKPAEKPVEKPVDKPAEVPVAAEKKPVKFGDADRAAADMQKLDGLTKQLLASGAAKPAGKPATDTPATDKPITTPSAGGSTGWKQIYDMNKDVIGDNPNLIKPGQQLKMPDGSTYTVKPGDNLSKIARGAKGETKKGGGAMPAAGGQPPYTPAKPELGTIKGATQAIPTGPTVPGNPSGVGKNQALSPDERKAAEEALKDPSVSLRDRQYYASRLNVKLPTQEDFNESGEDYNLTPMEAKAALIHGSEQDIEMLGGREKLEQIASSLRESASIKNSLIESFGYTVNEIGNTPAGLDAVQKVGQRAVRAIGDAGTGYSGSELANPDKTFAARDRANAIQNREQIRANDKSRAAYMQRLQQANPSVAGQGAFSNMADQLTKASDAASAVDKVAGQAGISAGEKAAGTAAAKAATSGAWDLLKKRIPFLATAYGAYDTVNRAKKGDYTGAGIAAASAAANLVPGVGTAASLGLDAMNIARDYQRGEFDESLSESIGNLRDRLKDIENRETFNESTAADIWKAAQNLGAGFRQPKAFTTDAGKSAIPANTPGKTAFTAGQSLRTNNVVPALAVGTGAGLMFGGDKDKKTPVAQVAQADGSNKGNKGQGSMPSAGATSADQQAIIDQMNEIIARYNGDGADDEILSYIVPAQNAIAKVTGQGSQTEFTPAVKESSDELARWLKIAHG